MYKPENDGKDHINVYSKGKTTLGRFLTNFANTPFYHPQFGRFQSVEGFWYWLGCDHEEKDRLRYLAGYEAKKVGRNLGASDWLWDSQFQTRIKQALQIKIMNSNMYDLFVESELPFTHYYVYGNKVVEVPESDWIIEFLEVLRSSERNGHVLYLD